ncbi:hypothetical protein JHK85_007188 [Glycine max]|nr:hypothetical protein JHK85_007188 [Glycine max]
MYMNRCVLGRIIVLWSLYVVLLLGLDSHLSEVSGLLPLGLDFNNKTEGYISRFNGVECWHPDENRVLNLKLLNMGLKGQFPRGIQNCSSLTELDLSINKLPGTISGDIATRIPFATSVILASNEFFGEIPVSLANYKFLNTLKLDQNRLTGQIPP